MMTRLSQSSTSFWDALWQTCNSSFVNKSSICQNMACNWRENDSCEKPKGKKKDSETTIITTISSRAVEQSLTKYQVSGRFLYNIKLGLVFNVCFLCTLTHPFEHILSFTHLPVFSLSVNISCVHNSPRVWDVDECVPQWNQGWWEGCVCLVERSEGLILLSC